MIENINYYLNKIDELYKPHHSQKLTKEQEKFLCIDLLESKVTIKDLTTKYNISKECINNIKNKYDLPRKKPVLNEENFIPVNINFFEKLDNEKACYWAGFILADGTISKNENRWGASLVIALSSVDKSHLDKFANDIQYEGIISDIEAYHKQNDKFYKRSALGIHRLKICEDLIFHGIDQNKSNKCKLPKTIPDKLMHHFIRGLIDGDGCYHVNKKGAMRFILTSPVYDFLIDFRDYMGNKCNLNKSIKIITKLGCWCIEYAGNKQCKRIVDYLYKDATVYLDRKYNIIKNHFKL